MNEPTLIRYLGPYAFGARFRCQLINGKKRTWLTPEPSAERAVKIAERMVEELTVRQPLTVAKALDNYAEYMAKVKGNKPLSVTTTLHRLQRFFAEQGLAVSLLTQRRCTGYYNTIASKQKPDTHRNTLSEARTFCRWLVKQHLLRSNPIDGIEPIGRRTKGKPQLTLDEGKRWLDVALEQATQGNAGAVAAMMTLLMGMRCSEVIERPVRDLDDNGRVVRVPICRCPSSTHPESATKFRTFRDGADDGRRLRWARRNGERTPNKSVKRFFRLSRNRASAPRPGSMAYRPAA